MVLAENSVGDCSMNWRHLICIVKPYGLILVSILPACSRLVESKPKPFSPNFSVEDKQFRRSIGSLMGMAIVDGKIGFTGGVGIADEWMGQAESSKNWRDTHYRIQGPVVAELQSAFLDNWRYVSNEILYGDKFFPALDRPGSLPAQMFISAPTE